MAFHQCVESTRCYSRICDKSIKTLSTFVQITSYCDVGSHTYLCRTRGVGRPLSGAFCVTKIKITLKKIVRKASVVPECRFKDTHPLHPRVLEDLSSTEAQGGITNQQFGYEILCTVCDVRPVLVWKLILALLDALKQMTLRKQEYMNPLTTLRAFTCA